MTSSEREALPQPARRGQAASTGSCDGGMRMQQLSLHLVSPRNSRGGGLLQRPSDIAENWTRFAPIHRTVTLQAYGFVIAARWPASRATSVEVDLTEGVMAKKKEQESSEQSEGSLATARRRGSDRPTTCAGLRRRHRELRRSTRYLQRHRRARNLRGRHRTRHSGDDGRHQGGRRRADD